MRRKIIVLGIAMLLIISGMAFVNMDRIVTAYPGDEGDGENLLNTSYAYDITEQLSKIITDVYEDGELAKGRAFGSKGEHFAAENIIAYEMDKIGLWNPNLNPPYLEQIEPIESMYDDFDKLDNLTDKLEVLEQEIKINGTDVIDGVIRPRWNLAGAGYLDRPLPNWLIETYNVYPRSWLTNNYSHTDLQIYRTLLMSWWDDFVKSLNPFIEQELLENESIVGFKDFFNWIMSYFEDYYEFTFETLNESAAKENFTWIDESFYNRAGFVYIEEDPAFNPDYNLPDWGPIMNNIMGGSSYEWMRKAGFMIRSMIWRFIPCCKGLIRFDFNDDTFNHELNDYWALPTIYVNKSIGEPIYEDAKTLSPSTSTIDFYVNQRWNEEIESYNVIGQINGTNPEETILIGVLYDSWWCQGTADSAIGVGMMLSIAKYMKELETEYNIIPKQNVKFIAFGGEEYYARGAYYYEAKHYDENIVTMIDLNQLGFSQDDPRLIFNVVTNNESITPIVSEITQETNYVDRTGDTADFRNIDFDDMRYLSDFTPFIQNRSTNIVAFVKDLTWKLHHRDGLNHAAGDVMDYWDWDDVNVTTEMIWNVTKYITVNPDCWFESISYEALNSPNDDDPYNDSIKATFSINSSLPHDKVMVKAELRWSYYPFILQASETEEFIVTSSGLEGSITVTRAPNAIPPVPTYCNLTLYLYNSTGRINQIVGISDIYNQTEGSGPYFLRRRENEIPSVPSDITGPQIVTAHHQHDYNTSSTDYNQDQITYHWHAENIFWPDDPYNYYTDEYIDSGETCTTPIAFPFAGVWNMTVRAKDPYGTWTDWSNIYTVGAFPDVYINQAQMVSTEFYAVAGHEYQFMGDGYGGEDPYDWDWSFGDGNTSTDKDTTNIYSEIGNYTVTLNATDDASNTGNTSVTVKVVTLKADFNTSYSYGAAPYETIYFNGTSDGVYAIGNRTWNFSDGTILYDQNVNHSFEYDGEYNVTLTVNDSMSNTDVYYQIISISSHPDPPEIEYVQSSNYVELGTKIHILTDIHETDRAISSVKVNITSPNGTCGNYTMNNIVNGMYNYTFTDTTKTGQYSYIIWVEDIDNNIVSSTGNIFNVFVQATIAVQTLKDYYGADEYINITDPPIQGGGSTGILGNPELPDWQEVIVTEDDDFITVDNGDDIVWKFAKGSAGYDEIWHNGSQVVANEQWVLEYLHNSNWMQRGIPYDVSFEQPEPHHVIVTREYTDYVGTDFNISYEFVGGFQTKIRFLGNISQADEYRIAWKASGINTDYIEQNEIANKARFWNNGEEAFVFDYSDVYETLGDITQVEIEQSAHNHKCDQYFYIGELEEGYFELDPNFGYESQGGSGLMINNAIRGSWFECPDDGMAESITAYISHFSLGMGGTNGKCAIYAYQNDSNATYIVGETEEIELSSSGWKTFTFSNETQLAGGTKYFLVAWAEQKTGVTDRLAYTTETDKGITKTSTTYDSWPDPLTDEVGVNHKYSIYCTYNASPVFSDPSPANLSEGISRYPTFNVDVNDTDGDNMNLTFYTNESGSWESFGSINLGSDNKFGYTESGDSTDDADGTILGTWFTCPADGTAYGIDFYAECGGAQEYPEHVKCALYYKSNNTFINETIEGSYEGLLSEPVWYELTFETPPTLVAGEEYYVVLWADETQGGNDIFYSNLPQFNRTISMTQNYNSTWPSTLSNLTYVTGKTYDFYVRYNTTSTPNGTYYMDNLAMGDVGSTYFWNVSVDDGSNVVLSDTYQFMVGKQSKIKNTGSTNISGYLLMQVQYYNATQGWVVDNDTINETNPRTVAAGDQLALDLIFNGNVTTSDLVNGDGTYRVYAAFRDEEGDVLVCDDESLLEAWYQFTVDTS